MKISHIVLAATAFLAAAPVAGAATGQEVADELVLCMQHREDAARLACFDRLARRATAQLESGATLGAQATGPGRTVPRAGEPGAPLAPERAAPAPAAPVNTPEAEFGLERSRTAKAGRADSIRSRIPGEFLGWEGDTIFELENGQVWRQTDSTRVGMRRMNPEVEISRGILGGFFLSVDGLNRRVRVERVE
jgi:hypothetical protein